MAKILLIWENIPVDTRFYSLDLEGEDLENIYAIHGSVVNINMPDRLCDWIISKLWDSEGEPGPWSKFEIKKNSPIKFSGEVISSGQMV